jgi:hypothetical protein
MKAEVIDFSQFDTEEPIAPEAPKAKSTIDFSQFDPKPEPIAPTASAVTQEPKDDNAWTRFVMGNTDIAANVSGLAERERAILGQEKQRSIRPDEALVRAGSNVISGVGGAVSDAVGPYIPQGVKDVSGKVVGAVGDAAMKVPKVQGGVAAYRALQDVDPQSAETAGAVANVASMAIPGPKGFGVPLSGVAKKIGSKGIQSLKRVSARKAKELEPLLADPIGSGRGDLMASGGLANRVSHAATPWELERNITVAKVPGVKAGNIAADNHIAAREAARAERRLLEARIKKAGNPLVNKNALGDDLGRMVEEITDSDALLTLRGNKPAQDYAQNLVQKSNEFIKNSDGTTLGILQARRDFDKWVEDAAGGFDVDRVTAKNVATKLIRDRINQEVFDAVPEIPVKLSLTKQSHLLDAKDRFLDQAKREGATRWERVINKVSGKAHVGPVGLMSIIGASGGGLTALATVMGLPVAAGVSGAALFGTLWAIPKVRRSQMLGSALTSISRKMRGVKGEPLKELSLQRAVLIEALKETQAEKEQKEPKGE